jgi:antitoxin HigA-1
MLPTHRPPTSPGEILREEFLGPLDMQVNTVAERTGIDRVTLSRILNGRRNITPETSVRLGRLFGVNDGFFLDLQTAVGLWHARKVVDARPHFVPPSTRKHTAEVRKAARKRRRIRPLTTAARK